MPKIQIDSVIITEHAYIQAFDLGMDGSQHRYGLYGVILDMAAQAAPIRDHPKGNYRFEEWVFDIYIEKILKSVHRIRCEDCADKRGVQMWDECLNCIGKNCRKCGGKKRVLLWIPCGNCTGG